VHARIVRDVTQVPAWDHNCETWECFCSAFKPYAGNSPAKAKKQ